MGCSNPYLTIIPRIPDFVISRLGNSAAAHSAGSTRETSEPGYAHTMSRQRLILIGLGSSAIFGS